MQIQSKQTDLGGIPKDWQLVTLGSLTSNIGKQVIDPRQHPSQVFELYSIPSYYQNKQPELKAGHDINSIKILVDNETVLFGKLNPRVPKIWMVRSKTNYPKIASMEFIPFIVKTMTTPDYVYQLLCSPNIIEKSKSLTTGSTPSRERVEAKAFFKLTIGLPSIREQQKIAFILSKVDELIQKTGQVIEQTQRLKKGLIEKLLIKGIGHTRFKNTRIGQIPEEWAVKMISEISELIMGQSPPGDSYNVDNVGTPLLNGPTEFGTEHPTPVQSTTKPTKLSHKDDILLFVRGSTTGRLNLSDQEYCLGRGLASIRGLKGNTDTKWLYYQFLRVQDKIYTIASGGGSTFPNINSDLIRKILLPYPKFEEQQKISSIISNVELKMYKDQNQKLKLEDLKTGLMQKLLKGKIRVKV